MDTLSTDPRSWSAAVVLGLITLNATGCIEDSDCGICDANNLILESISGVNYASDKIHILNPSCEGDNCPGPLSKGSYFIDEVIPCEETEAAQASPNAAEYCRLAPLVTASGVEFVFNNLLDPTSIELVRKQPDNPQLFEVYDWKTDVLEIHGPITRFNGDYVNGRGEEPDLLTRLVNLSCIDNIAANGGSFSHADYRDPATNPCNDVNPATGMPMKMAATGTLKSFRGILSATGNSCSTSEEGPDTCCSYCDYILSTKIERYGVDEGGTPRNPNPDTTLPSGDRYATAIECPAATTDGTRVDHFAACIDFVPQVDRSDEEQAWTYAWCEPGTAGADCPLEVQTFAVPLFDKLRETHPDRRPAGLENLTARCSATAQCSSEHGLSGTECIGTHSDTGVACLADAYDDGSCVDAVCRPEWVVQCEETPIAADVEYCQDRRFSATGAPACLVATEAVENQAVYGAVGAQGAGITDCQTDGEGCVQRGAGTKLAFTDWNESGNLTADEACQGSLYGPARAGQDGFPCDPLYQGNLAPLPLYERDENLPAPARRCICPNSGSLEFNRDMLEADGCLETVERGCYDAEGTLVETRAGQYAVKFADAERTRPGGIIYDPAIKGFIWDPADQGGIPRGDIETCASSRNLMADLNRHDGWRGGDTGRRENFEDFDRAMCSGQTYTIVFNEPGNEDNPAFVIDKADNTLAGKSVYTFETPQFHVQPQSGFPTDNLRIGACDEFSLRFSNKYDGSPENLAKLQIYRLSCEGSGEERTCALAAPDPSCDTATPNAGACCPDSGSAPVAGGPSCYTTQAELDVARETNPCAAPCLTVDISDQPLGKIDVEIDPVEFGRVLEEDQTYQLLAPMAETVDGALSDASVYDAVFWDACGMPLVAQDAEAYAYQFTIDKPKCKEDKDGDGVPLSCDSDNDRIYDRDQIDIDRDGFGANDLCPVVAGTADDTADSDRDGIGNACDNCRQTLTQYNANADAAAVPDAMMVRNIPNQMDTDRDGIGDACDNCVRVPNCESFGPDQPHRVGEPLAFDDNDVCQVDSDASMVGDACEGDEAPDAAGPVGFADQDDFDQDGLINALDACPRQPLPAGPVPCATETAEVDCGPNVACTPAGVCNHLDTDNDGVGDICDTCAFEPNPNQVMEGGAQEDDPDGDFVGEVCEIGADKGCGDRTNARPFGFFSVSALGNCCTTQLIEADEASVEASADSDRPLALGDLLLAVTCDDPTDLSTCDSLTGIPFKDGGELFLDVGDEPILDLPVRTAENCTEEQEENLECFALPTDLQATPGILTPPAGCEDALADAGVSALENTLRPLTDADFAADPEPLDALWGQMCLLPQTDQDYDGIADVCDKCRFAFDPSARPYVDPNGVVDPAFGAACNGALRADEICALVDGEDSGDSDTDDMGGSSGGEDTEG